ncbi:MAG TPA: CPBP family glutamic-type intramembrane protease [Polyangiaceae bacterium]|nr:CPBP family glutamic-type intramembrane protease [Polyangiaceae bacterium]
MLKERERTSTLQRVFALLADALRWSLHDRVSRVLVSSFVLIMLWGTHGRVDLLTLVLDGWTGPGGDPHTRARLIAGLKWDQEWIAFGIGLLLLVVTPCLLIRFWFRESPLDYGLGLPKPGAWPFTLVSTLVLGVFAVPSMYFASRDAGMRATYPFYREFAGLGEFARYEAGYLLFFVTIEFTFRGYLLFGLYRIQDSMTASAPSTDMGARGPLLFGRYSVLVSMLSYTAWHLGKPLPEQYGTLIWGLITGTLALRSGTIWHIVIVHFAMNVWLDYLIYVSL